MQAGPLAVVAGMLAAGGLVAALMVTRRGSEADATLGAARAAAERAGPGTTGAPLPPSVAGGQPSDPELAALLARIADTLDRIERALNRPDGASARRMAGGDQGEAGAGVDGAEAGPWYRRPGAILEWLPPDGLALAQGWFRAEMARRLAEAERAPIEYEAVSERQLAELRPLAGDDSEDARSAKGLLEHIEMRLGRDRRARDEKIAVSRRRLAALDAVSSAIDLARWMDEFSVDPPKRWQLAEFAAKRAGGK